MCGRWSCRPMLISRFLRWSEWDPVPELKGKSQEHNLMMIKWSKYGKKTTMHGFADFRIWKSPDTSYFPCHVFPRFSIAFPRLSMGPKFSMGFSSFLWVFQTFSMGFSGFSIGFSRFSMGFPRFSMGFYMVLGWSVEDALRLMMFLANPTTWTDIQRSLA